MRDSTILKMAAALGLGVFLWRVATIDPTVKPLGPSSLGGDPVQVVERATERVAEAPGEVIRWVDLAQRLNRLGLAPFESVERWKELAPKRLVRKQCGDGVLLYWLAYFKASPPEGDRERIDRLFTKAADRLEQFVRDEPSHVRFDHLQVLGRSQIRVGRQDAARVTLERAQRRLAENADGYTQAQVASRYTWLAHSWRRLGDRDRAAEAWGRAAVIVERDGEIRERVPWPTTWYSLAQAYGHIERWGLAAEALGRVRIRGRLVRQGAELSDLWRQLGISLWQTGLPSQAKRAWSEAAGSLESSMEGEGDGAAWYNLACYRALAGERAEAIQAWERAVTEGWSDANHAMNDSDLDSIREDPRFIAAMERIEPGQVAPQSSGLRSPAANPGEAEP